MNAPSAALAADLDIAAGYRLLLCAVFLQAVYDLHSGTESQRYNALRWLTARETRDLACAIDLHLPPVLEARHVVN